MGCWDEIRTGLRDAGGNSVLPRSIPLLCNLGIVCKIKNLWKLRIFLHQEREGCTEHLPVTVYFIILLWPQCSLSWNWKAIACNHGAASSLSVSFLTNTWECVFWSSGGFSCETCHQNVLTWYRAKQISTQNWLFNWRAWAQLWFHEAFSGWICCVRKVFSLHQKPFLNFLVFCRPIRKWFSDVMVSVQLLAAKSRPKSQHPNWH